MIEEEWRREESEKKEERGQKNREWNKKREDNVVKRVLHGIQDVASILTLIICGKNFEDWGEEKMETLICCHLCFGY